MKKKIIVNRGVRLWYFLKCIKLIWNCLKVKFVWEDDFFGFFFIFKIKKGVCFWKLIILYLVEKENIKYYNYVMKI